MLSASKSAFIPAFELHSAIARPVKNAKPSEPAGFEATRLTCSPMMCAGGQDARELGEMVAHRTRVGEEPIERDEGGNAGEERQECIERDGRCNREHPILADLMVNAPENVLPPLDRHLAWLFGRRGRDRAQSRP